MVSVTIPAVIPWAGHMQAFGDRLHLPPDQLSSG